MHTKIREKDNLMSDSLTCPSTANVCVCLLAFLFQSYAVFLNAFMNGSCLFDEILISHLPPHLGKLNLGILECQISRILTCAIKSNWSGDNNIPWLAE